MKMVVMGQTFMTDHQHINYRIAKKRDKSYIYNIKRAFAIKLDTMSRKAESTDGLTGC